MKLVDVIGSYCAKQLIRFDENIVADSLEFDSRKVEKGALFFCLSGQEADGHKFVDEAIGNGAVAIVCEHEIACDICQIVVGDSREALSIFSQNFFDNPIKKMKLISVVGTCGKTTTSCLIESILKTAGFKTGLIGTNGMFIDGKWQNNDMTTPDPILLNKTFSQMQKEGVKYVVLEVSAHAIALRKMAGIISDCTVFTNFSQDHLDFFGDMRCYANTKKSFFQPKNTRIAVVNLDDKLGQEIAKEEKVPIVTFGLVTPADVFALDVETGDFGIRYIMNIYDEALRVKYNLCGKFNVYNTLAASTACRVFGIKPDKISQGISRVNFVEGRNQQFVFPQGFKVVVDFAHTPEAMLNILAETASTAKGKLICVFGCGGDRDRTKRKLMGEAASKFSDYVILTSDNPRSENPYEIIKEIETGVSVVHQVAEDRLRAISRAILMAEKNDVVLVLGKGQEKYQEANDVKTPFSDLDVVRNALKSHSLR